MCLVGAWKLVTHGLTALHILKDNQNVVLLFPREHVHYYLESSEAATNMETHAYNTGSLKCCYYV